MSSPPDQPARLSRKRRRLLILVLVVMGFGIVFWVTRPRIDPRLVGVWVKTEQVSRQIEMRLIDFEQTTMTLRADGTGEVSSGMKFRWTAEGNVLQFVTVPNRYAQILPTPVLQLLKLATGTQLHTVIHYAITDVDSTKLTIQCLDQYIISGDRIEMFPETFDRAVVTLPANADE